ncbi:MAG: hypothetical protein M3Q78_11240 [Acidobacteriota bacterium]|nr:hypothetical protein [Acidobacteriota bacterium]
MSKLIEDTPATSVKAVKIGCLQVSLMSSDVRRKPARDKKILAFLSRNDL